MLNPCSVRRRLQHAGGAFRTPAFTVVAATASCMLWAGCTTDGSGDSMMNGAFISAAGEVAQSLVSAAATLFIPFIQAAISSFVF